MKRIYIIINAVLLLSILLLGWSNVRYAPPPEDKNVGKLPQLTALPPLPAVPLQLTAQDTAKMVEQNIFAPGRGKAVPTDSPTMAAARPQLQLMGICMIGNSYGAIIVSKDSASRQAPQQIVASNFPPNSQPQHQPNPNGR